MDAARTQVQIIAAYSLAKKGRKIRSRSKKKCWVHPWLVERNEKGAFSTKFQGLRVNEKKFYEYFQMSISSFDELTGRLQHKLQRQTTVLRKPISPEERLAIALRYLSTGATFCDLQRSFRVGTSTASSIIREVCETILEELQDECLPLATLEMWQRIKRGFQSQAQFPNCLGALGGKSVRLHTAKNSGNPDRILLMAVCDANYSFIDVAVAPYSQDLDYAFAHETFLEHLSKNFLNIPPPAPLPGTEGPEVPHVMVADESLAFTPNILRPFCKTKDHKKCIFNYRLSRAHRFIECTFALLSSKWKVFQRSFNIEANFAASVIKACCVLHNFVRFRDGYQFEDTLTIAGLEDYLSPPCDHVPSISTRAAFATYFLQEGQVPWQEKRAQKWH